ncbi:polyprenyl synthetase family protein [Flammeovirgaceae bacterium SG7u.111]|nr:polyprenyl synthetase family protein [Flammeovirgaceae bacterium SG7u.132]WPO33470.1 polyprenyl synthetase family protein [Flammeovirgaceae bacterium SG7u.111]
MADKIKDIQAPIASEMQEFEKKFRQFMTTKVALLDTIMSFIVKRKGKQIRPLLVFLSAGMCGEIQEKTFRGAGLIELLHTATLVHDDVVDDSHYRRGFFSINALWKNKVAVLVGDYLLSRGLLLSIDNQDFGILKIVSEAVREMSEGELLQMEKARKLDITEEVYFEIIRQKTATLISSCCAVGASSTGADGDKVKLMAEMGEKLGMAFQIKDDLFDYGKAEIGKPVGIDIKEKKMTLPLIYALSKASWLEKRKIIFIIKNQSNQPKKVNQVIDFVKNSGGLEYATNVMNKYYEEVIETLKLFPESPYKNSMEKLMAYVINRSK